MKAITTLIGVIFLLTEFSTLSFEMNNMKQFKVAQYYNYSNSYNRYKKKGFNRYKRNNYNRSRRSNSYNRYKRKSYSRSNYNRYKKKSYSRTNYNRYKTNNYNRYKKKSYSRTNYKRYKPTYKRKSYTRTNYKRNYKPVYKKRTYSRTKSTSLNQMRKARFYQRARNRVNKNKYTSKYNKYNRKVNKVNKYYKRFNKYKTYYNQAKQGKLNINSRTISNEVNRNIQRKYGKKYNKYTSKYSNRSISSVNKKNYNNNSTTKKQKLSKYITTSPVNNCVSYTRKGDNQYLRNNCGRKIYVSYCSPNKKISGKFCGHHKSKEWNKYYTHSTNLNPGQERRFWKAGSLQYAACPGTIGFSAVGHIKSNLSGSFWCYKRR